LARNVLALEKQIEDGEYSEAAHDDALLLQFHSLICGDLVPLPPASADRAERRVRHDRYPAVLRAAHRNDWRPLMILERRP
jgi:hypothetical protein